jgi:cellulose synthase/poly-beta-1,6-N-acetylglucosamine synthase-like glycosyltransferase
VGRVFANACELVPLVTFWIGATVLTYTFFGYGLLIATIARWRPRPISNPCPGAALPPLAVVLVAHNEEHQIAARLQNLLSCEYPAEKLRILLVSDGSTDSTGIRAEAIRDPRIEVIVQTERAGKAAGLNLAVSRCREEVVVFTDARQRFAPNAIKQLATHFSDSEIGAVSGALEIAAATSAAGAGVDAYWRYEKFLRAAESRVDSCIGCTGAIYALRRTLFSPIPEDTLIDDVVIPMSAAVQGARVIHDPLARASDPQPLEPAAERRRKQRTLAGGFQLLFRHPAWLLPWRNRLWWQLISHKYLRLVAPAFLLTAFGANLALASRPFYAFCLAAQSVFYACAAVGSLPRATRLRVFALPAGFVFLNLQAVRGFLYYVTRRGGSGWK